MKSSMGAFTSQVTKPGSTVASFFCSRSRVASIFFFLASMSSSPPASRATSALAASCWVVTASRATLVSSIALLDGIELSLPGVGFLDFLLRAQMFDLQLGFVFL